MTRPNPLLHQRIDEIAVPVNDSAGVRTYHAYGMTILSEIMLPELDELGTTATQTAEDTLIITRAIIDGPMPPPDELRLTHFSETSAYFAWHGIGRFLVHDCKSIEVALLPEADPALLSFILLGPVMAAILHGQGNLVLHGSAIAAAPDNAILFIGDNSAGKSTLAGAFLKAGREVINDDVIAISDALTAMPLVQPGFPAMKLSRAAIAEFSPLPGTLLPAVPDNAAKLRLRFTQQSQKPCQLSHVFVLQRGAEPATVPLDPAARLTMLLRHSYMLKFGAEPLRGPGAAHHFAQCTNIANRVPVSMLTVPDGLNSLLDIPEFLRTHS